MMLDDAFICAHSPHFRIQFECQRQMPRCRLAGEHGRTHAAFDLKTPIPCLRILRESAAIEPSRGHSEGLTSIYFWLSPAKIAVLSRNTCKCIPSPPHVVDAVYKHPLGSMGQGLFSRTTYYDTFLSAAHAKTF